MLSSGFFDSIGTDRLYYADSFNTFFEGLISQNGIFENVGGRFSVTNAGGLTLNVADGKALVNNRWIRSDAIEALTLDAAHSVLNRYDMITLRWNNSTRDITLVITKGENASTAIKPAPVRNTDQYEIVLAYVHLRAGVTEIALGDITDCRYDANLCGIITGLIDQVDVTNLYNQFAAKFQALNNQMEAWQTEQQAKYAEWFTTLTDELTVNGRLSRSIANYKTTRENGTQYIDVPANLDYIEGDVLDVFVNGILLVEGADYDLMMNEVENIPMIYIYSDIEKDNMITFYCLKIDNIGNRSSRSIRSSARIGEVTLTASGWVGETSPYSQIVNIDGVTANSQVDITPSVEQLEIFYDKDLTFVTENDNGVITVYVIGQKPTNDYTIQVTITEVSK